MDSVVLSVFNKELHITKRITLRVFDLLFLAGITVAGVLVRLVLFDIVSGDYRDFLQHWYDDLAAVPGLRALGQSVGNYNVPYLYLMKLMTVLPMRDLHAIKLVSGVFDVATAVALSALVWRFSGSKIYPACPDGGVKRRCVGTVRHHLLVFFAAVRGRVFKG